MVLQLKYFNGLLPVFLTFLEIPYIQQQTHYWEYFYHFTQPGNGSGSYWSSLSLQWPDLGLWGPTLAGVSLLSLSSFGSTLSLPFLPLVSIQLLFSLSKVLLSLSLHKTVSLPTLRLHSKTTFFTGQTILAICPKEPVSTSLCLLTLLCFYSWHRYVAENTFICAFLASCPTSH